MPKRSQQRVHGVLRMVRRGGVANACPARRATPPMHLPRLVVEIGVEPRQHHGACGSVATACRNFAVAGIEPVEPAAITGPS